MTLRQCIVLTASYYGRQIDESILEMYASDLSDLDEASCVDAYQVWRRDPKNKTFPLPAQIREIVCPEQFISPEALAREIAARIVGAVTSCGWNNGRSAEAFIGPVGWDAVRRAGGWSYICENLGVTLSPTTFQAQMRDLIESNLTYGSGVIDEAIALPERDKRDKLGLAPAKDILKRLTSKFDGDDGPGAA